MIYIAVPMENVDDRLVVVDGSDLRSNDGDLEILNHTGQTTWILAPGTWKFATTDRPETAYL